MPQQAPQHASAFCAATDMPQSQAADRSATNLPPANKPALQTKPWTFGLPSLPKIPWGRKPLDDTVSLPANSTEKIESGANPLVKRPLCHVITGIPRQIAFKRQDSERRERLQPFQLSHEQRRAMAGGRRVRAHSSARSEPHPHELAKYRSEPDLRDHTLPLSLDSHLSARSSAQYGSSLLTPSDSYQDLKRDAVNGGPDFADPATSALEPPASPQDAHQEPEPEATSEDQPDDEPEWQKDIDQKWILNLSMAFRDKSNREKFFLTYAELPNKWRRVTVSVDYRNAEPDSLESDLQSLHYQRDKSARIYESIHESLPSIRFFDAVTNLKLLTTDGRLHVHVTEDVNENIKYPPVSSIRHLELRPQELIRETSLHFDSHLSGFVYKVRHNGRIFIKKEIPAPEMVEEFLYEIAALDKLRDEPNIIDLEGVIVDEAQETIKGLLLSYASRGALIDYIYDHKHDQTLTWDRREKWARQIVGGLSAIHEHGFVQGDLTLSNIVLDAQDNARLIDLNRRGCPVGWEPPEFLPIIHNGQRISMFIGIKSDLYQLGMVLWGLAMQIDEPEREEGPLKFEADSPYVPPLYKTAVDLCLRELPRERVAAIELLKILCGQTASSGFAHMTPPRDEEGFNNQPTANYADFDRSLAVASSVNGTTAVNGPGLSADFEPSSHVDQQIMDTNLDGDPQSELVEGRDSTAADAEADSDRPEEVMPDLDGAANEVLGSSGQQYMAYPDAHDPEPGSVGVGLPGGGYIGGQFDDAAAAASPAHVSRSQTPTMEHVVAGVGVESTGQPS